MRFVYFLNFEKQIDRMGEESKGVFNLWGYKNQEWEKHALRPNTSKQAYYAIETLQENNMMIEDFGVNALNTLIEQLLLENKVREAERVVTSRSNSCCCFEKFGLVPNVTSHQLMKNIGQLVNKRKRKKENSRREEEVLEKLLVDVEKNVHVQ